MGVNEPIDEYSLHRMGVANPRAGWNPYILKESIFTEREGVWVAIDITVAWETWMTYWIDDVAVSIT